MTLPPRWRGALFFLCYWGFIAVFEPFLNVRFARLGLSGLEIGILAALYPLMSVTVAPVVSAVADRKGWRIRLLSLGIVGMMATLLWLRWPVTFLGLFLPMLLLAVVRSPTIPIADGIIIRMAERYHLDYGNMRRFGSVGFALSVLFGLLWRQTDFVYMFFVAPVAALPLLAVVRSLEEDAVEIDRDGVSWQALLQNRDLLLLVLIAFISGMAVFSAIIYSGVYMDDLGGDELDVGLVFGLAALAAVVGMSYAGKLIRRFGGPQAFLITLGVLALGFAGYVLADSPETLIAAALVKEAGFGLWLVTLVRLTNEQAPERWSATAQALVFASGSGLAPMLIGPLGGALYDWRGPPFLFLASLLLIGAAAALLLAGMHREMLVETA